MLSRFIATAFSTKLLQFLPTPYKNTSVLLKFSVPELLWSALDFYYHASLFQKLF